MRFIELRILNLASLDRPEGEIINFDEGVLGNSSIFSIVGPTGSGKSTILDAICLALYNRAPRYPRKKGDRNQDIVIYGDKEQGERNRLAPTDCRNILTQGRNHGYSKLTFVANNGNYYRAEWHVHFNRVCYKNAEMYLYKLEMKDGKWTEIPDDWGNLTTIIGLDYDQFLRTVLIAQGSFANFLTSNENDRYELLEKLIGCEGLYKQIASDIKQKKEEASHNFDQKAADFAAIAKDVIEDPEQLSALKAQIQHLQDLDQKVRSQLLSIGEALVWFEQEERYTTNIEKYRTLLDQAEAALQSNKDDYEQLLLHDATLPAVNLYEKLSDNQKVITELTGKLSALANQSEQKENEILQYEQELEVLRTKATQANNIYEQQKPHINKARTIKGELEAARKSVKEKLKQLSDCQKAADKAILELENNLTAIKRVEKDELRDKTTAQLQQAKSLAEQTRNDLKDAVRISHKLRDAISQKDTDIEEQRKLQERELKISALLSSLTIDALTSEVKTLRHTLSVLCSENFEQCRQELIEGQPCPLCGATRHPYQSPDTFSPIVNDLNNLVNEKEGALAQQTKEQQQLTKEQGLVKGRLQGLKENIEHLSSTIMQLQEEWNDLALRHPIWPNDEKKLQLLEPDVQAAVKNATELLNDFIVLQTERSKTENLKLQKQEKLDAVAASVLILKQAQSEVEAKDLELKSEIGEQDPDQLELQLTASKQKAETDYQTHLERISKKREESERIKGSIKTTQDQIQTVSAESADKQQQLNSLIFEYNNQHSNTVSIDRIKQLYTSPLDWEGIRHKQQNLNEVRTSAFTTLTNEQTAHQQHQEHKPASTREELAAQKTELEKHSNAELIDAQARLKKHEQAFSSVEALTVEKKILQDKKIVWEEINDAIGADGKILRKIAQCYTLRFLVEHANAEIRKFNTRYELMQVKNSLGLRVIDHDRADTVRDTTSLSGGETFIVSLGLALGLSSLSSRNISFQNLFIDEGFGTLDRDTLDSVIDSLTMLQTSQGKKVGIISHTEMMSERITTQIRIIKNGNSGSSRIEIHA